MCLLFPFLLFPFLLELPARKKTVTYCTTLKNKKKYAMRYSILRKYINFATPICIGMAVLQQICICHTLQLYISLYKAAPKTTAYSLISNVLS